MQCIVGAVLDSLSNIAQAAAEKARAAIRGTGVATRGRASTRSGAAGSGGGVSAEALAAERAAKEVVKWIDEVDQEVVEDEVMLVVKAQDWTEAPPPPAALVPAPAMAVIPAPVQEMVAVLPLAADVAVSTATAASSVAKEIPSADLPKTLSSTMGSTSTSTSPPSLKRKAEDEAAMFTGASSSILHDNPAAGSVAAKRMAFQLPAPVSLSKENLVPFRPPPPPLPQQQYGLTWLSPGKHIILPATTTTTTTAGSGMGVNANIATATAVTAIGNNNGNGGSGGSGGVPADALSMQEFHAVVRDISSTPNKSQQHQQQQQQDSSAAHASDIFLPPFVRKAMEEMLAADTKEGEFNIYICCFYYRVATTVRLRMVRQLASNLLVEALPFFSRK